MKLFYYQDPVGNFGDDLNAWLWPRLIPDLLDEDARSLFVGIGSILDQRIPHAPRKLIFGTGIGYGRLPALDARWRICCVRGPLTAHALGLPADRAITDPAALVRTLIQPAARRRYPLAFMPHFRTPARAARQGLDLRAICRVAGLHYIDPSGGVEAVLQAIQESEVVVAEAMHGAIVADALRIPWIPVQLYDQIRDLKWQDWCASLDLTYRPLRLLPGDAERLAPAVGDFFADVRRHGAPQLSGEAALTTATARLEERLAQLRAGAQDAACLIGSPELAPDPGVLQSIPWLYEIQAAIEELRPLIPVGAACILVDQAEWGGGEVLAGRQMIPFLERDGEYWGPPADDASAIAACARLRRAGAGFLAFAWPAFWWLDHYAGLRHYLTAHFPVLWRSARLIVFDLRADQETGAAGSGAR